MTVSAANEFLAAKITAFVKGSGGTTYVYLVGLPQSLSRMCKVHHGSVRPPDRMAEHIHPSHRFIKECRNPHCASIPLSQAGKRAHTCAVREKRVLLFTNSSDPSKRRALIKDLASAGPWRLILELSGRPWVWGTDSGPSCYAAWLGQPRVTRCKDPLLKQERLRQQCAAVHACSRSAQYACKDAQTTTVKQMQWHI